MATKDTFRARLARTRAQAAARGRLVLPARALGAAAQACSHFLLGAVLAGGRVFQGGAPFGLALVGGAGSGVNAAAALVGAAAGYLALLGFVEGLRYVSAAILTFSLAFAFYDTRLYKLPWTMPLAAAAMNGATGVLYLSRQGWHTGDVIWFGLELVLTALCAYGFRSALTAGTQLDTPARRLGAAALVCACLIALARVYLVADAALGPVLGAVLVLCCAWQGGPGAGAAAGVVLGLAADITAQALPLYAMALGAAGLAAGLARSGRRWGAALAFLLVNAAAVLWTWDGGVRWAVLWEGGAAALVFLLLPQAPLRVLGGLLLPEEQPRTDDRAARTVREGLEASARAFRMVHDSLRACFRRPPLNDNDTAALFDRAADRVCRTCPLRSACWERDYVSTFNALNDATQAMLDRGRGEARDFPAHFSSRCVRFPEFLAAVNGELTALLQRRQYASRLQDSRLAVCRQYGQLSDLLQAAADDLGRGVNDDPVRTRRLRQHLAVLGLEGEGLVCYDRDDHLRLEVRGPASRRLAREEELRALMDLMGLPMRREEGSGPDRLVLVQAEPLMAVAGIAARRRDGERVSGDAGTWFKRPDGRLYMLLCDGMGSGEGASRDSRLAVDLLEAFLRAGVDTENALVILNSALGLRGEAEGGFTTVDLLQLDLFTGRASIYKLGAAPTYVRKGSRVQRVTGTALPAGLCAGGSLRPDSAHLELEPGDWVVMVSDGLCPGGRDDHLRLAVERFAGDSPRSLAAALLEQAAPDAADDCTVLAVRVGVRR